MLPPATHFMLCICANSSAPFQCMQWDLQNGLDVSCQPLRMTCCISYFHTTRSFLSCESPCVVPSLHAFHAAVVLLEGDIFEFLISELLQDSRIIIVVFHPHKHPVGIRAFLRPVQDITVFYSVCRTWNLTLSDATGDVRGSRASSVERTSKCALHIRESTETRRVQMYVLPLCVYFMKY